jgi:hypothetical protein
MTVNQNRVDDFTEYLTGLEPVDAREVMRQIGTRACDKFTGVLVMGTVRNPADVGGVLHSLLFNLDPSDQVVAGMALLRAVTALMGAWFASPEMGNAPGVDRVNTQFSAIATQIARLDQMMTNPTTQPLIDPLPSGSIVQTAATAIAAMDEAEGLAAIEAVAMPYIQRFPGSVLVNEPKTGEETIAVVLSILQKQPPNVFGFAAMNLIGILAKCVTGYLQSPDNRAPHGNRSDAIRVMDQIDRTMQALGDRVNQVAS